MYWSAPIQYRDSENPSPTNRPSGWSRHTHPAVAVRCTRQALHVSPIGGFGDRVLGVFLTETRPDAVGGVALFARRLPVAFQHAVDEALVQTRPGVSDDGQMPPFVPVEQLFKGRHFDQEIVVLGVRWYLSFKLSYRDLGSMMGERGIPMAHTTILRWVQHYTPEFEQRWKRHARPVGGSWRMDETYVKVRGEWVYLYRAVDKAGKTVDFYLSRQRDVNAAKAFLRKAMKGQRVPAKIPLDAFAASHRAVAELKDSCELRKRVIVRSSKYLNNLIEQDHRGSSNGCVRCSD